MVKIGWLADDIGHMGGAEISDKAIAAAAPNNVEIVYCPPNKRAFGIDAFVINNCITYPAQWIELLKTRPIVKKVHDLWPYGDPVLRRWILDNADLLIFNSPTHKRLFQFPFAAPHDFIPPPIDVRKFKEAAAKSNHREGTIWFSRIEPGRGIQNVIDWAIRTNTAVDVYGKAIDPLMLSYVQPPCQYKGMILQEDLPSTLARYKRFVWMPIKPDLCGRVAVEAWAAGLKLNLRGDLQAFWDWIDASDFQNAPVLFWTKVEEAIRG